MNNRIIIHPRKKQKIFERDNFKCQNCGVSGNFNALEVDHIIPVIEGGTNEVSNLQTLCYKCNMNKRFRKDQVKAQCLDFSSLDRLEMIKNRIMLYKNLTYPEFKVAYTQDELLRTLNIDLLYLNDLFFEISGYKKRFNRSETKDRASRDRLVGYMYKNKDKLDLTQENISEIAHISKKTVWNILNEMKNENLQGIKG